MALDFNRINRVAAINPTTAFPLDARSYFESYEAALAAANSAKEAGDTTTVHYWGEILAVVENNEAQLYIIQPDGTLSEVGSKLVVDENSFAINEDGKLFLLGFSEAALGAHAVKGEDGQLKWVVPDTSEVDSIKEKLGEPANEEAGTPATGVYFLIDQKADKDSVYTKIETDTAINAAVVNASHLSRKIVNSVEEIEEYAATHDDAYKYIFMVPTGLEYEANKYYEYLVLYDPNEGQPIVEKVGSWDVDLTNYVQFDDLLIRSVDNTNFTIDENKKLFLNNLEISKINGLQSALDNKVTVIEGYGLVQVSEIEKLSSIEANAEENFIKSVDTTNFSVSTDGQLLLNDLPVNKITGLDELLNDPTTGLVNRVTTLETSVGEFTALDYKAEVGEYANLTHTVGEDSTVIDEVNSLITNTSWQPMT